MLALLEHGADIDAADEVSTLVEHLAHQGGGGRLPFPPSACHVSQPGPTLHDAGGMDGLDVASFTFSTDGYRRPHVVGPRGKPNTEERREIWEMGIVIGTAMCAPLLSQLLEAQLRVRSAERRRKTYAKIELFVLRSQRLSTRGAGAGGVAW